MSRIRSRAEKILALLPKKNIPSEDEDESEGEEKQADEGKIAADVDSFFQYLEDDFEHTFQGVTFDHSNKSEQQLFPKMMESSPPNVEESMSSKSRDLPYSTNSAMCVDNEDALSFRQMDWDSTGDDPKSVENGQQPQFSHNVVQPPSTDDIERPACKRAITFDNPDFPPIIDITATSSREEVLPITIGNQHASFYFELYESDPEVGTSTLLNEETVIHSKTLNPQPCTSNNSSPQPSTSHIEDLHTSSTNKKDNRKKASCTKRHRKNGKALKKPPKKIARMNSKKKNQKNKKSKNKAPPVEYEWHRGIPFQYEVSQPPTVPPVGNSNTLEPIEYFSRMFCDDMVEHIVFQSNLYVTQEKNNNRMKNPLTINKHDVYDYLAVEILTGVVSFPSIRDPWSYDLRFEKIASIMPVKKYLQMRQILHFNNNGELPSDDPYYKVRPLIEMVRKNFKAIPAEQKYSIDEMMIPYKGTRAGSRRQYMKDKPIRWGLKLFVLSGVSGVLYDFFLYAGESTFSSVDFTEEEKQFGVSSLAIVALVKSIPEPALKFIFFDNYYSNPRLMTYLRSEYGVLSLGTIRTNRFPGLNFKDDKVMAKEGRGACDVLVDNTKKLAAVKWLDNKPVHVVSSFCGAGATREVKRWSKSLKQFVSVKCPEIIQIYNEFMGGVDLSGQLVSFYRTKKKSRKWYMCIFYHIIDMCINNAWLLYRRDLNQSHEHNSDDDDSDYESEEPRMSLKRFRVILASQLLNFQRPRRGRPSSSSETRKCTPPSQRKGGGKVLCSKDKNGRNKKAKGSKDEKHQPTITVHPSIRFDSIGHFPDVTSKGRCRLCSTGQTTWQCIKCQIRVCLKTERNCFLKFHQKPQ